MFPEFAEMLFALSAAGARYLIVGGYAVAVHHQPRATKDIDILVERSTANARRVLRALDAFGAPRLGLTIADLSSPDLVFQIGVPPRRIDFLTSMTAVDFEAAWKERVEAYLPGVDVPVWVIGRKALLRNKRAVGRPQDLADVAGIERTPVARPKRRARSKK